MSLSLRPLPSLLLLALLGAAGIAMAGPRSQDAQDTRDHSTASRSSRASQAQAPQERPRQPRLAPPAMPGQRARPRSEDALSDSVRRIERSNRGQVLSAERVPYDGRNVNRIKVIDERGRVRVYMDDPAQSDARQSDDKQPPAPTRGDDD